MLRCGVILTFGSQYLVVYNPAVVGNFKLFSSYDFLGGSFLNLALILKFAF